MSSNSQRLKKTVIYMHTAAGFPPMETWINAIRAGNYDTWPGLSAKAVLKYFPESDKTVLGHMKGERQGLRSTSEWTQKVKALKAELKKKKFVPQEPIKKEHDIFIKVIDLKETIYTDQTGKFPYLSSKGNRYVMVGIHVDANYIFQEAMKNRTEAQMVAAYQRMFQRMQDGGLTIKNISWIMRYQQGINKP